MNEIKIVKGDTFTTAFRIKDKNGNVVQTDSVKKVEFENVSTGFKKELIANATDDVFVLNMSVEDTKALKDYTNYFNIVVYYTNGEVQTELYNAIMYAYI